MAVEDGKMKLTVTQLRKIVKEEVSRVYESSNVAVARAVEAAISKYKIDPTKWRSAAEDFEAYAAGENDEVRKEFYPGWEDQDFQTVVDALDSQRRRAYDKTY